jgi:hypothetical protein
MATDQEKVGKHGRCATCNKKLKITELNLCSCGTPVCFRHRYSTDHGCTRDFTRGVDMVHLKKDKVLKI